MRRLALVAALLLAAACTPGSEPDSRGAVLAQVAVPGQQAAVTHGNDPIQPRPPTLAGVPAPSAAWPCEGNGTDGRRVQFVYASDGTGNLAANRAALESYARRVEGTFLDSARSQGGERVVRFVTNGDCSLSILDAVVSPNALASFDAMVSELAGAGLNRPDRIYHVWTEANAYCGIGTVYSDDQPGAGNANERYAQYSRSDRPCWNYAEAHEITHNLGGVQNSAPNSTGGLHCRDDYDVMCYADGASNGQILTPLRCPQPVAEDRLDCNADDYFALAPPAGSYLANHWDVANASALDRSAGAPPPTTAPPPPPPPSTSTSTTSTTVGRGSTSTDLTVPTGIRTGRPVVVGITVSGACIPDGVVAVYVSGRLISRQVTSHGAASVVLTFSAPGRFTVRADYLGSSGCAASRDTTRPRVT